MKQFITKIKYKLLTFIDKDKLLSNINGKIQTKLKFFTNDNRKIETYSLSIIIGFALLQMISFIYNIYTLEVWYIKLIDLLLMLVLPILIIKTCLNIQYKSIINKAPSALKELLYWLYRTKKLPDAIRMTSENLNGFIKKPFELLYYDISKNRLEDGLQNFRTIFNNEHIDNFTEIVSSYLTDGGSIDELCNQISNLNINFEADNMFRKKIKERFTKYKIACIFMIIASFIMKKYIYIIVPGLTESYMHSTASKFIIVNIYFIIFFFLVDVLEYF